MPSAVARSRRPSSTSMKPYRAIATTAAIHASTTVPSVCSQYLSTG
jgi:hypothetical protein